MGVVGREVILLLSMEVGGEMLSRSHWEARLSEL